MTGLVLCVAGLMCVLAADSSDAARPAVIVELQSVDSLAENMSNMAKALEQPPVDPAMIAGGLGGKLNAPGLAGIDKSKPIQAYIFLAEAKPGGELLTPAELRPLVAFALPLQGDGQVYASAVSGVFPDSEKIGDIVHYSREAVPGAAPRKNLYVATVGGRAVAGEQLDAVQALQGLLAKQPAAAAAVPFPGTFRVRVDAAACIPSLEAGFKHTIDKVRNQPMPQGTQMNPAAILEAEGDALIALMRELRSYTVGIKVTPTAIDFVDRLTPLPGTKTEQWVNSMSKPSTPYLSAVPGDALMAVVSSGMNVMDLVAEPYGDLMEGIYAGMGPPMDGMGPLVRQWMMDFKGVYSGDLALSVVPAGDGKGVGFIELIAVTDPAKAKQLMNKMVTGFNDDFGEAMPGLKLVELPDRQHGGTTVEVFSYAVSDVTNQPPHAAYPPGLMKWLEGMRWEIAFVGNHLVYTAGGPEIMDAALDRLASGGTDIDKSPTFKRLFPQAKGNIVEVHTMSLSALTKRLLGLVPNIDQATLAAIPESAGIAGYSTAKSGNLIGIERISLSEVAALKKSVEAIGPAIPSLMMMFGAPGMQGGPRPGAAPMPGEPPMGAPPAPPDMPPTPGN